MRWIVAAVVVCGACNADKPAVETKAPPLTPPVAVAVADADVGPDMCELFFTALDRLPACANMRVENQDAYKKIAREVQATTERPFGKGQLAKCQMSLHMLRTDVKLDCPELAAEIPDVEIP